MKDKIASLVLRFTSAVVFCLVFFILFSYHNLAYRSGSLTSLFYIIMILFLLVSFIFLLLFSGSIRHMCLFVLIASLFLYVPEAVYLLLSLGSENLFRGFSLKYLGVLAFVSLICVQVIRFHSLMSGNSVTPD